MSTREARDRHFRDLYARPTDFKKLARLDAEFAAVVKGRELDFRDPASVMQLTKTLLRLDFGIKIHLPDDRLCPPVPNRHNYILWLKDLLDTSSYDEPGQKRTGLDIGTGASCIYPLLGCAQRPWSFIATDVDSSSLEWAKSNVRLNDLSHRINVVLRSADSPLIPLDEPGIPSVIDFTMTNPPFYASEEEMLRSAKQKQRPPYTACTGSATEMVTDGGELAFVRRVFAESMLLRGRVQWYTAMFGFLASLTAFVETLHAEKVCNYAVTEFVQGNKTRRWAIAWSFQPLRPAQSVARGTKAALSKNILPCISEVDVLVMETPSCSIGDLASGLSRAIASLDLVSWDWNQATYEGVGCAPDKVWARAWRRRKKREQDSAADKKEKPSSLPPSLSPSSGKTASSNFGFKVWIRVSVEHVAVGCRWLEGFDATAFESFQGFLKTTAKTAAALDVFERINYFISERKYTSVPPPYGPSRLIARRAGQIPCAPSTSRRPSPSVRHVHQYSAGHPKTLVCAPPLRETLPRLCCTPPAPFFSARFSACERGLEKGLSMSAPATAGLWEAKSTEALRKKLFYEFAVFVLGCGNPVILLLLWPGWLIVGGLVFALWRYCV
ncbi:hypothetical protein E4U55_005189 [Claviceps digitariae]|nr:hypothetical protein E4U55_005189 [Claviceps digitariae]